MADTSNKKNIREESLRDLSDFLTAQGEKAFRAKQIWQWIWQRGVTDFAEMSNLSKATRELLSRHYFFDSLFPQQVQTASDGTEKTAWRLTDGEIVESVLIPGNQKFTVCVSSQVGCQLGCKFCATGTLGFKRNLTAGEIFEQVVRAQQAAEAQGQHEQYRFHGNGRTFTELRAGPQSDRTDYGPGRISHVTLPDYGIYSRYPGKNQAIGRRWSAF